MVSAVGLVNAQGGKAILVSNDSPNTTTVKMPTVSGELAIVGVTTGIPSGTVVFGAYQTAPDGWLICDGSSHPVATYPNLHAAIGNTFGGDATNFNLPDLRGEFIRGWDDARGVDSGRAFGSSQADGVGPIGIYDPGHAHGYVHCFDNEASAAGGGSPTRGSPRGDTTSGSGSNVSITGTIAETRPKNVALLPIIKY